MQVLEGGRSYGIGPWLFVKHQGSQQHSKEATMSDYEILAIARDLNDHIHAEEQDD